MTNSSALSGPDQQAVQVHLSPDPPGVVYAVVILTWIAATATAGVVLFLTASLIWLAPLFDAFASDAVNPAWYLLGFGVAIVALSAFADVVAYFLLRGRRWARWVLLSLCVVAALGGVIASYYVVPLLVTAAAVGVAVLLLLPRTGAWIRACHSP